MKEVLSVPGGKTQEIIKEYLIHAHPYPRSYKDARYMAIRRPGGIMDRLYSIQCEFVLQPQTNDLNKAINFLNEDAQLRVEGYIANRAANFGFDEKVEYKFYLLSVDRELAHLPETSGTLQGHTYFTVGELTSGRKKVLSESKLNKD